MEARIDIVLEEEKLRSGLAKLNLNNNSKSKNTSQSSGENERSQTNQQGIIVNQKSKFEDNIKKGDNNIKIFSLMEHSGSDEDKELSLSLLENALEYYQNSVKVYSYAPELYQIEETQRLSYQIKMTERLRDFHLRPAFYRFGDSSLAYSNEYMQQASPVMIKAFNKGLEILKILLERLEEEFQQEQEEKSKQKQSTRMQLPVSGQQYLANTASSTTKELLSHFQENKSSYKKFTKEQHDDFEAYANRVKTFSMQQEQYEASLTRAIENSDISYMKQQFNRLNHQIEYIDSVEVVKYLNEVDKAKTDVSNSKNKRVRDNDNNDDHSPKTETGKKKVKIQIKSSATSNKPETTSMKIEQYNPYNDGPEISKYSLYY